MKSFRKKLGGLKQRLPMSLDAFAASVELPKDKDCFEFAYFQVLLNIFNMFKSKGSRLLVCQTKDTTAYRKLAQQSLKLANPDDETENFSVEITTFVNGAGDCCFARVVYDKEAFFIESEDNSLLKVSVLA